MLYAKAQSPLTKRDIFVAILAQVLFGRHGHGTTSLGRKAMSIVDARNRPQRHRRQQEMVVEPAAKSIRKSGLLLTYATPLIAGSVILVAPVSTRPA